MQLVTGQDEFIAGWIGSHLDMEISPPFSAIGILDGNGTLRAGWLINNYNGHNADISVYAPGMLNRRAIGSCYANLFIDHRLTRATALTRRNNQVMRDLMPRLGFQFEGLKRRYFGPSRKDDAFSFVLFRDNAEKWIR